MKKVKFIFYSICLILILSLNSLAQERDSLIQLYPEMGDTLDFIDRKIFDLYKDFDEFKYAQIYSRDNTFFVTKITHSKYGKVRDKVLVEDISKFEELQMKLDHIILENEKKFQSPFNASVYMDNNQNYIGRLEMFSKKYLYFNSDINYVNKNSSPFRFKTSLKQVDSLKLQAKKPNLLPYVGYGSLIGAGIGALTGVILISSESWMVSDGAILGGATLIGWGVGALIGLVIGSVTPTEFITIKFNSPNDILILKNYSPYYFNYRKSLEESYVELE